MGRNKELKEPVHIGCEIEKDRYNQLDEIRWREHKDRAEVLRLAIDEFIQRHGAGNTTFRITDFEDPDFRAMPAYMSSDKKWSEYIRNHMSAEELDESDRKAKFIREEIDAKRWLDKRNG